MKQSVQIYISAFLLLVMGTAPIATKAFVQEANDFIFIGEQETIDDNAIFLGENVDIVGTIKGDLIVAASVVNIKGDVEGDIIAVGSDITINGSVAGDVRVFSGSLIINSVVGGNVTAATGKLTLGENAEVGHSVTAAAGLFENNGAVVRNITIAAGSATIDGPVGGNLTATIDSTGRLILLSDSRIGGNVNYTSSNDLERTEGAEVAGVIRKVDATGNEIDFPVEELFIFLKFLSFLSILLIGLILIYLFPKTISTMSDDMLKEPGRLTLLGFAYFFLPPFVLVLLLVTIIGAPLAIILFVLYFVSIYFAKLAAAIAIGKFIIAKTSKEDLGLFFPLISGILLLYIITCIPIVGWVVSVLLTWWGLAGIVQWCYTQYKQSK